MKIPGHDRPLHHSHCPLCARYHSDPRYRALVDGGAPAKATACVHLGEQVGETLCAECTRRVTLKLFECGHPRQPLGAAVCAKQGCGPQCSGYATPKTWWKDADVQAAHRQLAAEFIEQIDPYPSLMFSRRGIVVCGGGKYFASAYVTLRMIRQVGCTIPIELWHLPGEIDDAQRAALADISGVATVDAGDCLRDVEPHRRLASKRHGWELKSYALKWSHFREVLALDSDCYPVRDPSFLFDLPAYRECGACFWPDMPREKLSDPLVWQVMGVPFRDEPSIESGVILIDKAQCWQPLSLAVHYNEHSDFYYQWSGQSDQNSLVYGDKDLLRFAWHRLGRSFVMMPGPPKRPKEAMLQAGPDGETLFVHRCNDKFRFAGECFDAAQTTKATEHHDGLPLEAEAQAAFRDLLTRPRYIPTQKITLCIPTLNRYDLLQRCIASARAGTIKPDVIRVIDNGGKCPDLPGVHVTRQTHNLGVAASWNWFVAACDSGHIVIANDDIVLRHDALERLICAAESQPESLVVTADEGLYAWSLFAIRRRARAVAGDFDESFWPAYCEDTDYAHRLRIAGAPAVVAPGAHFTHDPGSSAKAMPAEQRARAQESYDINQRSYRRKWGGPPRGEKWQRPYNVPLSWDAIPGAFNFAALYDAAVADCPDGGIMVEVGSYLGRSLVYLAQAVQRSGKRIAVHGVEWGIGSPTYQPQLDEAAACGGSYFPVLARHVREAGVSDIVTLHERASVDAAKLFADGSIDFAFIDAAHDYQSVHADLLAWYPKVKYGGTMAGHDYGNPEHPDVRPAVDAFFLRECASPLADICWLVRHD